MKRIAFSLLVFALILSLCGCKYIFNDYGQEDVSEKEIGTLEKDIDEYSEQEKDHTKYWNWKDGVYSNSFVGLTFETFEGWRQYTNEELIQLQDDDYANLHSSVRELYKERIVYAACSNSQDKDSYFNLCYENKQKLEKIKGKEVSLEAYVAESKTIAKFMYKEAELLNEGDVIFCGNTYKCLEFSIYTSYNGGGYIRKNIYFRQVDDYFVTLTLVAGPFGNETIEDIVARCSAF